MDESLVVDEVSDVAVIVRLSSVEVCVGVELEGAGVGLEVSSVLELEVV